jgi:hypothetical protein
MVHNKCRVGPQAPKTPSPGSGRHKSQLASGIDQAHAREGASGHDSDSSVSGEHTGREFEGADSSPRTLSSSESSGGDALAHRAAGHTPSPESSATPQGASSSNSGADSASANYDHQSDLWAMPAPIHTPAPGAGYDRQPYYHGGWLTPHTEHDSEGDFDAEFSTNSGGVSGSNAHLRDAAAAAAAVAPSTSYEADESRNVASAGLDAASAAMRQIDSATSGGMEHSARHAQSVTLREGVPEHDAEAGEGAARRGAARGSTDGRTDDAVEPGPRSGDAPLSSEEADARWRTQARLTHLCRFAPVAVAALTCTHGLVAAVAHLYNSNMLGCSGGPSCQRGHDNELSSVCWLMYCCTCRWRI